MIEYLDLEIRNEDQLVAEAISRTSGGLTAEIVNAQIRERQEILKLIDAGLETPVCPELTNANPSAPHTVLLEAFGWMLAQIAFRFNKIPQQNHIAFANLFGIEPKAATGATTILEFTINPPADTNVTIPEGTQVSSADGQFVFETSDDLVIPFGDETGEVEAVRTVPGHTLLSSNVLTEMIDSVAFVESVTNPNSVDSGTAAETLESTLNRVKRYQKRGERLVSTKDLEEAILDEALDGNGIVRAFPFIANDFNIKKAGHTTIIVMTRTGEVVDSIALQNIAEVLKQTVGNQFIYIVNPFYVEFSINVNVRLTTDSPSGEVIAVIENNLRNFYSPSREQFGRAIYRSEIIAVIEGTNGVDRIEAFNTDRILISPVEDRKLRYYELAKLVNVNINIIS